MTPADIVVSSPTAAEILRAVVTAAELEGEDPIDVLQGKPGSRARLYAGLALAHQFPTAPRLTLGARVGKAGCLASYRSCLMSGAMKWFSLGRLNAVRAVCGWPAMTLAEAEAAPLTYCGRHWAEFLPGAAQSTPPAVLSTPAPVLSTPTPVSSTLSAERASASPSPAPARVSKIAARVAAALAPNPAPVEHALDTPAAAPAPRLTPSPAAAAIACAAVAMRAAPERRVIKSFDDLDLTGIRGNPAVRSKNVVAVAGEPPPGRSALDQRNGAAG